MGGLTITDLTPTMEDEPRWEYDVELSLEHPTASEIISNIQDNIITIIDIDEEHSNDNINI